MTPGERQQAAYREQRRLYALAHGRPYPEDGGAYAGRSRTPP